MEKFYKERVKQILKEVERILIEDASRSQGVKIVIEMGVDELTRISYDIKEMAVKAQ